MVERDKKVELLGDCLVRLFSIEYLNERLPAVPYNRYYGGTLPNLQSNDFLSKLAEQINLTPVDTQRTGEKDKRYAMAFEIHLGELYLAGNIEEAKQLFFNLVDKNIDIQATVETFQPSGGVNLIFKRQNG